MSGLLGMLARAMTAFPPDTSITSIHAGHLVYAESRTCVICARDSDAPNDPTRMFLLVPGPAGACGCHGLWVNISRADCTAVTVSISRDGSSRAAIVPIRATPEITAAILDSSKRTMTIQ